MKLNLNCMLLGKQSHSAACSITSDQADRQSEIIWLTDQNQQHRKRVCDAHQFQSHQKVNSNHQVVTKPHKSQRARMHILGQ